MPWQDRVLAKGAYTSPGGTILGFDFEDVSGEVSKRAQAFEFPLVDGTYVQDNGHSGRRYPLRCIFWGNDHDLEAKAFESALLERGIGRLQHPFYGVFDVVPFGDITRRDDLKDAANQTIVEVTFFSTIGLLYPSTEADPGQDVLSSLDDFDTAAAGQFEATTDLSTTPAKANVKTRVTDFLNKASAAMTTASDATAGVRRAFADAQSVINQSIDVLIGQPLLLAQQINNLIKFPARATSGILDRLDGYRVFARSIYDSLPGRPEDAIVPTLPRRSINIKNDFYTSDLFAANAISGASLSVVENTFFAKPEALMAAEDVLAQFAEWVAWRDAAYATLGEVDTGETYQGLQQTVALTAGFLVQISFTLVPERVIVLDAPRTIIDLSAEIYGSIDDRLDFLISSNKLSGAEILELPRGKAIKYYATA